MGDTDEWRRSSKCRSLNTQQVDRLFFPDKGGKSKQARLFCSNCPVVKQCLKSALRGVNVGFQAGTTPEERKKLKEFLRVSEIPDVEKYLPASTREGTSVSRPRTKNPKYANRLDDPLYNVHGPTYSEEVEMLYQDAS